MLAKPREGAPAGGLGERELVDRFFQEARAAAAVGSHRVVQIFDVGQFDDGSHYLLMEYVRGRSLSAALAARGALPVNEALLIATRVADTLAIAHQRGIVHRDIKPANLMLLGEGRDPAVKVLDFGIARASGDLKLVHTTERRIIGSPGYMSPEVMLGSPADGRSDVFSLAVTLYETLAGRPPFSGANFNQIMMATLTAAPLPPSALRPRELEPIPVAVERLLAAGLVKDPQGRPAMAEFLAELVTASDAVSVERGAPMARSVMRQFVPAPTERPTLAQSAPEVVDLLAGYGSAARPPLVTAGGGTPLPPLSEVMPPGMAAPAGFASVPGFAPVPPGFSPPPGFAPVPPGFSLPGGARPSGAPSSEERARAAAAESLLDAERVPVAIPVDHFPPAAGAPAHRLQTGGSGRAAAESTQARSSTRSAVLASIAGLLIGGGIATGALALRARTARPPTAARSTPHDALTRPPLTPDGPPVVPARPPAQPVIEANPLVKAGAGPAGAAVNDAAPKAAGGSAAATGNSPPGRSASEQQTQRPKHGRNKVKPPDDGLDPGREPYTEDTASAPRPRW